MNPRLYVGPITTATEPAGSTLALTARQSHYLLRVLRLRQGDALTCFDGQGCEYAAHIERADSRAAVLRLTEPQLQPPATHPLHLALGILKSSSMDLALQKATELGVTDVWPLKTEFTAVSKAALTAKRRDHWHAVMASACEQCGRAYVPNLHEPRDVPDFLNAPPTPAVVLFDTVDGKPPTLHHQPLTVMIGPEGGWSERERSLARDGATVCTLGQYTFRAETMPIVALAAVRQSWGWMD